jgi:carbamoyl-phosphate synthase large subunit
MKIVGFDSNSRALGRFFVDEFHVIPPDHQLTVETWLNLCKKYSISRIIPSRDGELSFFADNRLTFSEQGIEVMISSREIVESCQDKLSFSRQGKTMGLPVIPGEKKLSNCQTERIVVKERFGSGARQIGLNLTPNDAKRHGGTLQNPIYQPFISGREYTIDAYITRTRLVKGLVCRLREQVEHGESQVTFSVEDRELEELSLHFFEVFGKIAPFFGHILIQVIKDFEGKYHIIECNPRFGGASHLSVACGLKSLEWFLKEAGGELLEPGFCRDKREKRLIRYPDDWIQEIP